MLRSTQSWSWMRWLASAMMVATIVLLHQHEPAFAFVISSSSSTQKNNEVIHTRTMTELNMVYRPPERMRVNEIKEELKELGVSFADCFDKESLVDKLAYARANPRPRPPPTPKRAPPSPRAAPSPSYSNVEFGAESDMNSDIGMDVFAQAGWTEDQNSKKGMSPVDHDRSPGLNRNFDELGTDDFKQPYRG
eukprot:scaffold9544_cov97-Cylindrotheca_fusiformis.AAC.2